MKILIAEDDPTSAFVLEQILVKEGYEVTHSSNGEEAFIRIQNERFDALLTDWMMPRMNGIELIRKVRCQINPIPVIMVITGLSSRSAKSHAIQSGADEYLAKPIYPKEVIERLEKCFALRSQVFSPPQGKKRKTLQEVPPFAGVVIGTSSGGPLALKQIFTDLKPTDEAAFFVVLHGPAWMLETFAEILGHDTSWPAEMARDGVLPQPGHIYVAPGEKHMCLSPGPRIRLTDDPVENYVRPAIDPLFRSAASVFGFRSIAVILTGMGCDGALGAARISQFGGTVLAEDPQTAMVGSMPARVVDLGIVDRVTSLENMGATLKHWIRRTVSK